MDQLVQLLARQLCAISWHYMAHSDKLEIGVCIAALLVYT